MEDGQDKIPDWKIPPEREVSHRYIGNSAKKRVRKSARRRQSDNNDNTDNLIPSMDELEQNPQEINLFCESEDTTRRHASRLPPTDLTEDWQHNHDCGTPSSAHLKKITNRKNYTFASSVKTTRRQNLLPKLNNPKVRYSTEVSKPRPKSLSSNSPFTTCPSRLEPRPATSLANCRPSSPLLNKERPQSSVSSNRSSTVASSVDDEVKKTDDAENDSSDEYDTDFETELTSDFRKLEYRANQIKEDCDIGHITYEEACYENKVKPRRRVQKQLWEKKLDLRHGGLLTPEVKAIAIALSHNHKIEEVDMSSSNMSGQAVGYMFQTLQENIFITRLNVSGSIIDMGSAEILNKMLSENRWLTHLNLSECSIGDNEIAVFAHGIRENKDIRELSLSKNKICLSGGLLLGRALGDNKALTKVDLSWNHIRGGGAVAICHSLLKNKSIVDFDLSWNGLGFEGSLALGEALKANSRVKKLNLRNNRINWDGAPFLAKALAVNDTLEELDISQNPISMEGCEEIMSAICNPCSKLKYINMEGIPINTKIALLATDITKDRDFVLEHGGILSTKDVIGIQRTRREDPFSLLIRYLSAMGIRVMDLFRMFDKDNKLYVSRQKFIQGLKRVRVPLDEDDILVVAKRLQSNKRGQISYQELATTVRSRIREDRLEDRRQEIMQKKKREERRRILQSDNPLNASSNINHLPNLYNMYGKLDRTTGFSPIIGSFSRRGSDIALLPHIKNDRGLNLVDIRAGRKTPMTLVRQDTTLTDSCINPSRGSATIRRELTAKRDGARSGSSYVSQMRWQQSTEMIRKHRFM